MFDSLKDFSLQISDLIAEASLSVVTVRGYSKSLTDTSVGSGWVYSDDGFVVTNLHVIEGMREPLTIIDKFNKQYACKVIGSDGANDLAVLFSEGLKAKPLRLNSNQPRIGSLCFAIGSPLGRRESASMGIISGLYRQEKHPSGVLIEDMLQTDATINPGNSGGPLISAEGLVIGVNTMGTGQNINFSVSAATVQHIIPELIEYGCIKRASLGLSVSDEYQHSDKVGVAVMACRSESSLFNVGDIIVEFNGNLIEHKVDLMRSCNRKIIGKKIEVKVYRDNKKIQFNHQF